MIKRVIFCLFVLMAICSASVLPKRVKTNIEVEMSDSTITNKGSFIVSTDACETCNHGYSLSQIVFSGYDKTISSKIESFFITNKTDCLLESVTIEIEYLTTESAQLHKRYERIAYPIPAGETRKIDIRTWDKQNSFFYYLSVKPRRQATPFMVRITPLSCTLRSSTPQP